MARARKKMKRLLYLRASFSHLESNATTTLEAYLQAAYLALPLVRNRVVEFAGQAWTGTFYRRAVSGFSFQFSAATPGESATTVPTGNLDVESVELDTTAPPAGREFSDGDIICCVSGDHIFACMSSLRDNKIQSYLLALFSAASLDERAMSLRVDKPADFDKIRLIQAAGVKSIRLNASLGDAEFSRLDDLRGENILRKVVRSLVVQDRTLVEAARDAGGRFKLELSMDRKGGGIDPSTKWIDAVATEALDGVDSYRIETQDGKVITPEEITISKVERFEPFGKSVFISEALTKLEAFKNEFLQTSGTR